MRIDKIVNVKYSVFAKNNLENACVLIVILLLLKRQTITQQTNEKVQSKRCYRVVRSGRLV